MKAGGSSQKLMLFIRGKAMSGAPIMIGTNQLPKPPIIAGMTMKKTMIRPWALTSTFHMCSASSKLGADMPRNDAAPGPGAEILDAGLGQLGPHQARDGAADDPGGDREEQIEGADVLVVGRHEPADEEARLVVGVVMRLVAVVGLEMGGVCGGVGHDRLCRLIWSRFGWWSPALRSPRRRCRCGRAAVRTAASRRRRCRRGARHVAALRGDPRRELRRLTTSTAIGM